MKVSNDKILHSGLHNLEVIMNNLIDFANWFCSYLLVYVVFIAVIVIAFVIGVSMRKAKNAKAVDTVAADTASEADNS